MGAKVEKEVLALLEIGDVGSLRRDVVDVLRTSARSKACRPCKRWPRKDGGLARSAREALNAIAARTR